MDDYDDIPWDFFDDMPDDLEKKIKGLSDSDLRRFADGRFEKESDFDYLRGRYGQRYIDAIVNDPLWKLHKEIGEWFDEKLESLLSEDNAIKKKCEERRDDLTSMELTIFELVGKKMSNQEICFELSKGRPPDRPYSRRTLENHINEIYSKFLLEPSKDRLLRRFKLIAIYELLI